MALTIGTQLGSHEIIALLGKGGMGEVYRARDLKLKREVALKIIAEEFSNDADRMTRFQREAEVLASLNHPNIGGIHSLEEASGTRFLVLELIDGETLAEKLRRGPIAIEDALKIGKQICGALEAAHEKGVVHRDLKPANIKIASNGTVKLLDFGLAALFGSNSQSVDPSNSPTLMSQTAGGMIVGTAAYMSPEQARGQRVGEQSDIWAFGCVLFEMLTGRQPFAGGTVTDILANILNLNPDFKNLPEAVPPTVRLLIRRCLEKDRHQRLHDIADARIEISEVETEVLPVVDVTSPKKKTAAAWTILALMLGLVLGGFSVWVMKPDSRSSPNVMRVSAALPTGDVLGAYSFQSIAISPDGNLLAYVAQHDSTDRLYLRDIGSIESKPLDGTEGANDPFFSPDGKWIGFFSQGSLKKVSIEGGTPQILCSAPLNGGGSWGESDIYFAPVLGGGLWTVPVAGGQAKELTKLDRGKNEFSHRWPQVLPGGKAVIYTVWTGRGWDEKRVELVVLKTGERRVLVQGGSSGRYVPSGHLVYSRAGTLTAVPFDLNNLAVTGSPVTLAEHVGENYEATLFAASDSGVLAYTSGSLKAADRRLVWVTRNGDIQPLPAPARSYEHPRISPDGRSVALGISEGVSGIWIYDLARSTLTPLSAAGSNYCPIWTPDGAGIIFQSIRGGVANLFRVPIDGAGQEENLFAGEYFGLPGSVTGDGKLLAYHAAGSGSGPDVFILPLDGDRRPRTFLNTMAVEIQPTFSPDGAFLAYTSSESGRYQVYVQPLNGSTRNRVPISTDGGAEPVWSRNGRELFYRIGDKMMVVDIISGANFAASKPRLLFEGAFDPGKAGTQGYDISPDGQRFLMLQPIELEPPATQIQIVLNWFTELQQRVPVK